MSQSIIHNEGRQPLSENRAKTPSKEPISFTRQGTPSNQRTIREIKNHSPYPSISSHFLEVYQNEINLEDHLEMRKKYHNSSTKGRKNLPKSQSFHQIKSFNPDSPFREAQSQLDFVDVRNNQSDYENSREHYYHVREHSAGLARNSSKARLNSEPKQVYYAINSGVSGVDKYSKNNIFDLPAGKSNKAHQYNFSFTEREFSEMNK